MFSQSHNMVSHQRNCGVSSGTLTSMKVRLRPAFPKLCSVEHWCSVRYEEPFHEKIKELKKSYIFINLNLAYLTVV
jgi:hypothetical protein